MAGGKELIAIDNLKSGVSKVCRYEGVSKVCRYEPDINQTYQEMAAPYGTAVLPARVQNPLTRPRPRLRCN
ncbi:hypothetical protein DFAR_1470013 [Desulfarculales bacterium]